MSATSHRVRYVTVGIVGIAFFALAAWLLLNRQFIVDQIAVWQYPLTSDTKELADRSGMNGNGEFIYHASQPIIEHTQAFNQICGKSEQSTNILGCYTGGRIYVYGVDNSKLDGIEEVTAAHEMLHAAYARLDGSKRAVVDAMVEKEYQKHKDDDDLKARVAYYQKSEPGELDNELHSILGTEYSDLDSQLEDYYKLYFADRSMVTSLHTKYAAVFKDLQNQANDLSTQLGMLSSEIELRGNAYNADVKTLNDDIATFNSMADAGSFASQGEFQTERAALVDRADKLDDERQAINDLISKYNQIRGQLESIASQSEALNDSVNSSLAPAPSL